MSKNIGKNREKRNRKIIFESELSETNNEQTFRLYQKNDKKSRGKNRKLFLAQNFLKRIIILNFRLYQKIDKKSRKKI